MAKTDNLTDFLTDIADAIREKKGTTGAINPQNFSSEIASIESGGGGGGGSVVTSVPMSDVNFLDYDGTILFSYTKEQFLALSAMPELPTREGLICQGWNWTFDDAKEYVTDYGKLNVGAMYITNDGATRLYIRIASEGRMDVPLYWSQTVANGVGIDWGDGSAIESFSGTGILNATHTYAKSGDYVIRLIVINNCTLELGDGTSVGIMGTTESYGSTYRGMLQKVEIGTRVTEIASYAFYSHTCLTSVTIPNSVTSIGNRAFQSCYSLVSVTIPASIKSIATAMFNYCYSLKSIVIPVSVASIAGSAFYNCYALLLISLPNKIGSIGASAFRNCSSLASIIIPSSLTIIQNSLFYGCQGMAIYDFTHHTSVPTLVQTNAFTNIPSDCIIKVPASLEEKWKSTSNWATYASQIVGV